MNKAHIIYLEPIQQKSSLICSNSQTTRQTTAQTAQKMLNNVNPTANNKRSYPLFRRAPQDPIA